MVPFTFVPFTLRKFKLRRDSSSDGNAPDRSSFPERLSLRNLTNLPISEGIVPVNWLSLKVRRLMEVRAPISVGIVPTRELPNSRSRPAIGIVSTFDRIPSAQQHVTHADWLRT